MSGKPLTPPPRQPLGGETVQQSQTLRVSASWEAPLPPPAVFEAYERTLPGCASRLVRLVERELEQRHKASARGQLFAFILGMTGMICGTVLIANGKSAVALIPLISALLPLLAGFLGKVLEPGKQEPSAAAPRPADEKKS